MTKTTLKSADGKSHEYTVLADGRLSIGVVSDFFSESGDDWCTPEGYEWAGCEHEEKDDTFSWHESPKTIFFRALPPPVEPDTAPLTHRLDLTRFTKEG